MDQILEICIKWGVPFMLTGICGYTAKILKKFEKTSLANSVGTKVLLEDKLREYHREYVEHGDGTIGKRSREISEAIYTAYHDLGGNGTGTKMFKEIDALNIKGD